MRLFLVFAICILPGMALAAEDCKPCKEVKKPKIVKYSKTTPKPHKQESCCLHEETVTDADSNSSASSNHRSSTGNQSVVVNVKQPATRVIDRKVVYKTRIRVKRVKTNVYVYRPNRLQLLLGQSKTKLEVEQDACCSLKARREYEPDLGLQYIRDFGKFTGSVTGTINNSLYLGVGLNW